MKTYWHEYNPWKDEVVYVPIEKLAECVAGGEVMDMTDGGKIKPYDVAHVLKHFRQCGRTKLDAYILPQPSGHHSLGVRWGKEGEEYYSPYNANPKLTAKLLAEYQHQPDDRDTAFRAAIFTICDAVAAAFFAACMYAILYYLAGIYGFGLGLITGMFGMKVYHNLHAEPKPKPDRRFSP